MTTENLPQPLIFIADAVAERATGLGVSAMHANAAGMAEVVRYAAGYTVEGAVGAVVIRNFGDAYRPGRKELFRRVPENGSLEETRDAEIVTWSDTRDTAADLQLPVYDILNHKPTENRLARGFYSSVARATTHNDTHVSSKSDKWFGSAMGLTLGLAVDVLGRTSWNVPSLGEWTGLPYLAGAGAGLLVGRLLLAPALAQLRKGHDMKLIRRNPPIRLTYAERATG